MDRPELPRGDIALGPVCILGVECHCLTRNNGGQFAFLLPPVLDVH